jgi:hypothetical protein
MRQEKQNVAPMLSAANTFLSQGLLVHALDMYNRILFEESPGNPIALLNRSLCYHLLEHPALAAMDACKNDNQVHTLVLTAKLQIEPGLRLATKSTMIAYRRS